MLLTKYRTKIFKHTEEGLWFVRDGKEYFISFKDYPALGKEDLPTLSFYKEDDKGTLHWFDLGVSVTLPLD